MTAHALLRELSARGIRVSVLGDSVSLRGPGGALTAQLTEHLRQHKGEIVEAARRCPTCSECGAAIVEPSAWWGGEPVHVECGNAAWRCEWKGEVLAADAPGASN
jgi:hypothetical protein